MHLLAAQPGGIDDGAGERLHLVQSTQDARPAVFAHHLFDRASVVDVDQIRPDGVDDAGGLAHLVEVAAENLDAYGALLVVDVELHRRVLGVVDEAAGRDELGVQHIGPVALAQNAKRRVAHVLHGREKERAFPQFDRADLHFSF